MDKQDIIKQIWVEIGLADKIVISRHLHPDGDAIGASFGLKNYLNYIYGDNKKIYVVNDDFNHDFDFLGSEDQVDDEILKDALLIVLDTSVPDRVSNKRALLASKIVKIDHHVVDSLESSFFDLQLVIPTASSTCEVLVDFFGVDSLPINVALPLYCGILTDTGKFSYNISRNTFECAGILLESGVDVVALQTQLSAEAFDYTRYRAAALNTLSKTEHGVAFMKIPLALWQSFGISELAAGDVVSDMRYITDSLIYIIFEECADNTVRVRVRSRFVPCRPVAVAFGGGGHEMASGINLVGNFITAASKIEDILALADRILSEYKLSNPDKH